MQLSPIKVLVLHRNAVASAGLAAGLGKYGDFEVVEQDSGHPAAQAIVPPVDVVIADYEQGIECVGKLKASARACVPRVLIVTPSDRESDIRYALDSGARGYMLLDSDFDDLARGVREVYMGSRALSRRIAQHLAESVSCDQLTCREAEVLQLVVAGNGNKTIARRLNVAVGTVKSHLKSIFEKLGVQSRTQAISVALRRGLLPEHEVATENA